MTLHTSRLNLLLIAVMFISFVSCSERDFSCIYPEQGMGKVCFSLYTDIEVKASTATTEVDDYNFRYVWADGSTVSEYFRYGDVSWPMEWYFGIYMIQAESCTASEAEQGYGCLRYEGVGQAFSVVNDVTASASVTCKIANCRVQVNFNDKMFLSFKDFKLTVESVLAPVFEEDEEGNAHLVRDEQVMRSLDFTTIDKIGYYNVYDELQHLRYTLYVMLDGAEEFVQMQSGYLADLASGLSAPVKAGDFVTLNVNYVGDVVITDGVKFIIEGERKSISTSLGLNDYQNGSVTEDN